MTGKYGDGLYVALISVHGLVRGHNLELGRDADTGGQTKYVVELARALAAHPEVARVDLLTRQVFDPKVDPDYAEPLEQIAEEAYIVRIPFGPRRYLRKEVLWPYLDTMVDNALPHIRRVGRLPDVVHSHYADAGYVGARLAALLGVPLIYTGHSLGRDKRRRLLDKGMKPETIESQYYIGQRIEAEEVALDSAAFVIASTRQEVEAQYSLYDNYQPKRMKIIPPGVDLSRFHPPRPGAVEPPIKTELDRFLREPDKPMVLALSRPDERKNIPTLIEAFGENEALREKANLVLIAGNRNDIAAMEKGPRDVLAKMFRLIDRYDLYGSVAYPKHHAPGDVPDLYRLAAKTRGVFINPALTEPFGLTLIEAAASGLPIVATEDGGPRDIVGYCQNGVLIDPLDADHMGEVLKDALSDTERWKRWTENGLNGAHKHFSWDAHAAKYMDAIHELLGTKHKARPIVPPKSRLPTVDRIVVCDVDDTLLGDDEAMHVLAERLRQAGANVGFGVATGRRIESVLKAISDHRLPTPDLLITSVGTEIYYGHQLVKDRGWERHTDYRWEPEALLEAMQAFDGLKLQPATEQRSHKISYYVDAVKAPKPREVIRYLRQHDLHANVVYSHSAFLDLLPIRASKGLALGYLAAKWGLPPERLLVAGQSGNDADMLLGNRLGVVVGNFTRELARLRGRPRIFFAQGTHAWGVLEGLEHYDFLGQIRIPQEEWEAS